jgi:predicted GTPase
MSISAFSQTAPAIDKAFKDPKREENAAKADVYLHKEPVIADSIQQAPAPAVTKTAKRKKQGCRRKPNV